MLNEKYDLKSKDYFELEILDDSVKLDYSLELPKFWSNSQKLCLTPLKGVKLELVSDLEDFKSAEP